MQPDETEIKDTRSKKLFLYSSIVPITLILSAVVVSYFIPSILKNKILSKVRTESGGLYEADIKKVRVSILRKSVEIDSFVLRSHDHVAEHMNKGSRISHSHIHKIKVKGIGFWDLLFHGSLAAQTVEIINPSMQVSFIAPVKSSKKLSLRNRLDSVLKNVGSLKIGQCLILHGNLECTISQKGQKSEFLLSDLLMDFNIQSGRYRKEEQSMEVKKLQFKNFIARNSKHEVPVRLNTFLFENSGLSIEGTGLTLSDRNMKDSSAASLYIHRFHVNHFNFSELLDRRTVLAGNITFIKPEFLLKAQTLNPQKVKDVLQHLDRYLPDFVDNVLVLNTDIKNGKYKLESVPMNVSMDEMYFSFVETSIHKDSVHKLLYSESVKMHATNVKIESRKGIKAQVHRISANSEDGSFLAEYVFFSEGNKKFETERNWYEIRIPVLNCTGMNFIKIQNFDGLMVEDVGIDSAQIKVGVNLNVVELNEKAFMPARTLARFKGDLLVKNINFNDGKIRYSEIAKNKNSPGIIEFTNANIHLKNLTNDLEFIRQGNISVLEGSAKMQDTLPIKIYMHANLDPEKFYADFNGSGGKSSALICNTMLIPVMDVSVKRGEIDSVYFTGSLEENRGIGEMHIYYKKLRVEVLSNKAQKDKKVVSFLGNMVVKNDGKKASKGVRMEYARKEDDSFVNFFWGTLRNGIVKSMSGNKMLERKSDQARKY